MPPGVLRGDEPHKETRLAMSASQNLLAVIPDLPVKTKTESRNAQPYVLDSGLRRNDELTFVANQDPLFDRNRVIR